MANEPVKTMCDGLAFINLATKSDRVKVSSFNERTNLNQFLEPVPGFLPSKIYQMFKT